MHKLHTCNRSKKVTIVIPFHVGNVEFAICSIVFNPNLVPISQRHHVGKCWARWATTSTKWEMEVVSRKANYMWCTSISFCSLLLSDTYASQPRQSCSHQLQVENQHIPKDKNLLLMQQHASFKRVSLRSILGAPYILTLKDDITVCL